MKAIEINGEIKTFSKPPNRWKNYTNFNLASEELLKQEGFFDVIQPEHNTETQRLGEIYFDEVREVFTYPVIDKTQEELDQEKEAELNVLDSQFNQDAAKRILRKVVEPILADEANLTSGLIDDAKMLFKQYRVGVSYDKDSANIDEKRFVWNGELYKVIGARHTSQSDWTPDASVSLYAKITPPGVIAEWVQPTGAHDAYEKGAKVTWKGYTWENTINENVYEPGVYGWINQSP